MGFSSVPMRLLSVAMSAGGMALRLLGITVRVMMSGLVVMMCRRSVMGRREHVVLMGWMLVRCHDQNPSQSGKRAALPDKFTRNPLGTANGAGVGSYAGSWVPWSAVVERVSPAYRGTVLRDQRDPVTAHLELD